MIKSVNPDGACVVIVDESSLRILSAICKVYDILEEGVSVIEQIEKKRQPLPACDAIYFLTPTRANASLLCKDFAVEKSPQHRNIHIFLTAADSDESFTTALINEGEKVLPRVVSFVSFFMDFVAYEQRVYHLDRPNALMDIYHEASNVLNETLARTADQLVSLIMTLEMKPTIRFQDTSYPTFHPTRDLSRMIEQKLTKLDCSFTHGGEFLVLDRSIDLATLWVHDYTYQAMTYDLLPVTVCSDNLTNSKVPDDAYQLEFGTSGGQTQTRTALLNESDTFWVRYRHQHMSDVRNSVQTGVKKFAQDNSISQLQKKTDASNDDTLKAIRALPQYKETLSNFSTHMSICEGCYREFNRRSLNNVGVVEQDLACGVDKDGHAINIERSRESVFAACRDGNPLWIEDKLRLLFLYKAMTTLPKEVSHDKEPGPPSVGYGAVDQYMRLRISKQLVDDARVHRYLREAEDRLKMFAIKSKSSTYELSRYEPAVREIIDQLSKNSLNPAKFPFAADPDRKQGFGKDTAKVGASRARKAEWDFGTTTKEGNEDDDITSKKKPTVVIFILGGVTMAEMRCAYEASREQNVDVLIGGSTILTARNIIERLMRNT
eukprot:GHVP01033329.1.p1 GENE.GHVP01033329.1~~GHVP01033329.1.p1  ORF type:complete len:605 (+),score=90.27 GHVP01033329.1:825-2639(+)